MKTNIPAKILSALAALPLVALAQGPLSPPTAADDAVGGNPPLVGGNPAPTMKTLHQVEPRKPVNSTTTPGNASSVFVIDEPGSYYLTDSVIAAGKIAITITETDVTLDLNGFFVFSTGTAGILIGNDADRCTIRNGKIFKSSGGFGINRTLATADEAEGGSYEDLSVTGHGLIGLLGGKGWTVTNCRIQGGGNTGISVGEGSVITGCSVRGMKSVAGTTGIGARDGSVITECAVTDCDVVFGIRSGTGSTVENCTATGNSNSSGGLGASGGIGVDSRSTVRGCTAANNTSTSSGQRFGSGISAEFSCLVVDCQANNNEGAGIVLVQASVVRGNKSHNNSGAGVFIRDFNGADGFNQIEGNSLSFNDVGIDVDSTANLITGNRVLGSGENFQIVSGNRVGTVVIPPSSGALSGFGTTASGSGATDPFANISF